MKRFLSIICSISMLFSMLSIFGCAKIESNALEATATLKSSKVNYTGKSVSPSVICKDAKNKALKNGTDYTISGTKSATKIGPYKLTVTFKGKFSGKKTLSWQIVLKKPEKFSATPGENSAVLTWSKTPGAEEYRIYKSVDQKKWPFLASTKSTTLKAIDLAPGKTYYFRVRAKMGSAYSDLRTLKVDTKPKMPSFSSLKASGQNVTATVKAVSGATSYTLQWSTSKDFKSNVKETTSKQTKITCTTYYSGKTYYFRVRANRNGIKSKYSPVKSLNIKRSKDAQAYKNKIETEPSILVLVNKSHPFGNRKTSEMAVLNKNTTKAFSCTKSNMYFDKRAVKPLQNMLNAYYKAKGKKTTIISTYRTWNYQNMLYTKRVKSQGVKSASKYTQTPGASEHQTGLAVDLGSSGGAFLKDTAWFLDNSYKYGFIQRYPKGKESITGIGFESWHFRYVGVKAATEIHKKGICLEEYVK